MVKKNKRPEQPLITLVAPVFNESKMLGRFFAEVSTTLKGLKLELILVDDGSQDDTYEKLITYAVKDPRINIIKLSRNFGKEAALTAGIDKATGHVVIPVDVDLQDPLHIIHEFITAWKDGYDIVRGVRADRSEDTFLKRSTATQFYKVFNWVSDIEMEPHAGDFCLLDRSAVEALKQMPERVRFMKGIFSWVGFASTQVHYQRHPRLEGATKFNFTKLFHFALDGIFSFSSVPIRIWSFIGTLIAIPAFLYMAFIIIKTLVFGQDVPGYTSLISIILFMGGVQLISLGVIGEYIGRIFVEIKARPLYIIEKEVYFPKSVKNAKPHKIAKPAKK